MAGQLSFAFTAVFVVAGFALAEPFILAGFAFAASFVIVTACFPGPPESFPMGDHRNFVGVQRKPLSKTLDGTVTHVDYLFASALFQHDNAQWKELRQTQNMTMHNGLN